MENILKRRSILIAEDEPPMLEAIVEKFKAEGARVIPVSDGSAALETALKERPELILLDILMPKMDGMEVLDKIRHEGEWGKKVPIIMLTNLSANDKIMQGIGRNEPSYYLIKTDWKLNDVVEKAKSCLEGAASE